MPYLPQWAQSVRVVPALVPSQRTYNCYVAHSGLDIIVTDDNAVLVGPGMDEYPCASLASAMDMAADFARMTTPRYLTVKRRYDVLALGGR